MAFFLNGNPISIDSPFTAQDGTRYPNLRDPTVRAKVGVVEVADPEQYDQRFYWGVGNPKDLDGLKSQWVSQVKDTAGKMLAQTDWMVVRKAERGVDIPADVTAKRYAIVTECDRLESAIKGCTNVEQLISVVGAQNWGE
jgi:hypothetical protein